MTTDVVALLRAANPVPDVPPSTPERRAAVLDAAVRSTPTPPPGRRRTRRTVVAVAACGAFVTAGGGAYAVIAQDPQRQVSLTCVQGVDRAVFEAALPGLSGLTMDSLTGDPVADCASELERLDGASPPLTGYDTGDALVVVPTGWKVPSTWTPLDPTFRSDPRRLELQQRLQDFVEGPESRCRTAAETEALVRRDLADLGLTGYAVRRLEQASSADGRTSCAIAFLGDPDTAEVLVQGLLDVGEPGGDPGIEELARALRQDVAGQCLSVGEARNTARRAIAAVGFSLADAKVAVIEDAAATCTRVDFVPAGLVVVVLRGPAS